MMLATIFTILLSSSLGLAQSLNTNLTLPWGTFQGVPLEGNPDIYHFKNVRFGSQPVRFGPPSFPGAIENNATVFNYTQDISCYQLPIPGIPGTSTNSTGQSEDCLFLDIYVPKVALVPNAPKLPVVNWIYGGAFAFGEKGPLGKDLPLYSGQGLIESSLNQMIFVAGNYRLGAFGWLAGTYMEQSGQNTLPNAGLYDQRLTLQFVHNYISKVGGDVANVSAWGESGGASSILHHLIQFNGTRDPLFNKALVQSPAYEFQYDRNGTMNDDYLDFSEAAGCGRKFDIQCLRAITNVTKLVEANAATYDNYSASGIFPWGPVVDGTWVSDLPTNLIQEGKFWPRLDNIVVSHVANESGGFTPTDIVNNATLQTFLGGFFPEPQLAPLRQAINTQYQCDKFPYNGDYRACARAIIGDSSFYCNTRELYNAYSNRAYMMKYTFPGPLSNVSASHATDLLPEFINNSTNVTATLESFGIATTNFTNEVLEDFSRRYRAYFASYGVYGDPNRLKNVSDPTWNYASPDFAGNLLSNTLEAELQLGVPDFQFFDVIYDTQNSNTTCSFWAQQTKFISSFNWAGRY